jgi:putative membrane protein
MMRKLSFWSPALIGAVTPTQLLAQSPYAYSYGHPMWGGGWHAWFFGPMMMIVFLAVVVVLVVLLVRWLGGAGHAAPPHPAVKTPLDILKERFARGEIDKEELEERRRVLGE